MDDNQPGRTVRPDPVPPGLRCGSCGALASRQRRLGIRAAVRVCQEDAFGAGGTGMDCGCPKPVNVTVSAVWPSPPFIWIVIWCTTPRLSAHRSSAVSTPAGTAADLVAETRFAYLARVGSAGSPPTWVARRWVSRTP